VVGCRRRRRIGCTVSGGVVAASYRCHPSVRWGGDSPRYPSSSSLTRRPERKGPTSGPRSHSQADASKVTGHRAKPCLPCPTVSNLKNHQGQPDQQQEQREGSSQDPKNEAGLLFNAGMRRGRSHGDQFQRNSMFRSVSRLATRPPHDTRPIRPAECEPARPF
jgi:hypothetical protein